MKDDMIFPARCHCGSNSSEHRFGEQRWLCTHCKRQMWMPIVTAPKDGSIVFGYFANDDGSIFMSHIMWVKGGEMVCGGNEDDVLVGPQKWFSLLARRDVSPTHWMPLPEPPRHD